MKSFCLFFFLYIYLITEINYLVISIFFLISDNKYNKIECILIKLLFVFLTLYVQLTYNNCRKIQVTLNCKISLIKKKMVKSIIGGSFKERMN